MLSLIKMEYINSNEFLLVIVDIDKNKKYEFLCNIIKMWNFNKRGGKGQVIVKNLYNKIEEYVDVTKTASLIVNKNNAVLTDNNINLILYGDIDFVNNIHKVINENIYLPFQYLNIGILKEANYLLNNFQYSKYFNESLKYSLLIDIIKDRSNIDNIKKEMQCLISEQKCLANIFINNNYSILNEIKLSDIFINNNDKNIIEILNCNKISTIKDYIIYIQNNYDISKIKGIGNKYKDKIQSKLGYIMYLI